MFTPPKSFLAAILTLALAGPAIAAPQDGAATHEEVKGQDYQSCTSLVETDAGKALAYARDWKAHHGGDAALHCEALALMALGHADEAAAAFSDLATRLGGAPASTQAEIYAQSGNAWALAANPAKAEKAFDEAIRLAPDEPDYRLGRARIRAIAGQWEGVRLDAGEALAEQPNSAEALTLRAAALRNLGYPKAALNDAERAVAIAPHNLDALLERGRVRAASGDVAGARSDWEDVIRFAKAMGRSSDPSASAAASALAQSGK